MWELPTFSASVEMRVLLCAFGHMCMCLLVCHLSDLHPFRSFLLNLPSFSLLPPSAFMKCTHLPGLFLQYFKKSCASYLSVCKSPSFFCSFLSCSPHLVFNRPPHDYLPFNEFLSPSHAAVTHPTEPWMCLLCHVWFCVCVCLLDRILCTCAHTHMYVCECNRVNTSHLCVSC